MLGDDTSTLHWGPSFTIEEMMMQVLFLSKGFLTVGDALTTNQQNESR